MKRKGQNSNVPLITFTSIFHFFFGTEHFLSIHYFALAYILRLLASQEVNCIKSVLAHHLLTMTKTQKMYSTWHFLQGQPFERTRNIRRGCCNRNQISVTGTSRRIVKNDCHIIALEKYGKLYLVSSKIPNLI